MRPLILANAEIKDEIIQQGVRLLRNGTPAEDVAEYVAREVEDDPDEHTVGYSGYPNILGEVELDASFMNGSTLRAGAVAGLKGFRHPISVARKIAELTPHVLLVGTGAARFADEIKAERRDMLTDYAKNEWRKQLALVDADGELMATHKIIELVNRSLSDDNKNKGHDTMNVIVRDAKGHLVSAVTTSGLAWKYPGRAGDSPIIGAGNYCDARAGAAACMGLGEITMRLSSSARAVFLMRAGASLDEAGRTTVSEMLPILGPSKVANHMERADWIRMLLIDKHGNIGGYATRANLHFKTQDVDEATPRLLACEWVQ